MSILQRLEASETFGIKLGLDNIRAILRALGEPQNNFRSILIAGTNGKGSVAAMLATALMNHPFKTGLYTSPHLVDVRERIRVQNEVIQGKIFENILEEVFAAADFVLSNAPTYFEVLTAAALLHFSKEAVEYAVIEVGMGGRYDATNAVFQCLSIITSIGLDHEKYLGYTLIAIAGEKAAISKPRVPMITGVLPVEASSIVEEACRQTGSELQSVKLSNIVERRLVEGRGEFFYLPWGKQVRLNLRGKHQIDNAAIVLLAADSLGLEQDATLRALTNTKWPGRMEILADVIPPLLLDCAHNPMGARTLTEFWKDMGWGKVIVLFTAMQDKNIAEMFRIIEPGVESAFLTRVEPLQRCASTEELMQAAMSAGIPARFEQEPEVAFQKAKAESQKSGRPLVVFGSIYFIGRMYSALGLSV